MTVRTRALSTAERPGQVPIFEKHPWGAVGGRRGGRGQEAGQGAGEVVAAAAWVHWGEADMGARGSGEDVWALGSRGSGRVWEGRGWA